MLFTVVAPAVGAIGIAACSGSSSSGDDSSISNDGGSEKDSTVIDSGPKKTVEAGVDAGPKKYCASDAFIYDAGTGEASAPGTPQQFDSVMAGCAGKSYWVDREALCATGCKVCSTEDWITRHGSELPTSNYWTDDLMGFSGHSFGNGVVCGASPYGPDGSFGPSDNPGLCDPAFLTDGGEIPVPMHVCADDPAHPYATPQFDRFGNSCTWVRCAYTLDGSVPPNPPLTPDGQAPPPYDSMGGCSDQNDRYAGTLCCCE